MNIVRGLRRTLVVATVLYWCIAASVSVRAYTTQLDYARSLAEDYRLGRMYPSKKEEWAEGVRRGILGTPLQEQLGALRKAAVPLGIAASIYFGLASTLAAIWWIVSGFRSDDNAPPRKS